MIYEINKTQSYKPKRKQLLIAICGFIKQMKDESWDWRVLPVAFIKTF